MNFELTALSKNDKKTGLADIVSVIFSKKLKDANIKYKSVEDGKIEKIKNLTMGWKEVSVKGKKESFYFAKDENGNLIKGKDQKSFLPLITAFLIKDGFKDDLDETFKKPKTTKIKDITNLKKEDAFQIDFDNFGENKVMKKEFGTIEILNQLFNNKGNELFFPLDEKYQKINENSSSVAISDKVKKIHTFKKLMGGIMIDYPFELLKNLTISSSSFNILADGFQPTIVEDVNGNLFETSKVRSKVLVENGVLRINGLLGKLTKEDFDFLLDNGLISEKSYNPNTIYKINLKGNVVEGNELPIISENIKKIPQDEIVNTVFDINYFEIKQSVLNSKIKELNSKIDVFKNYEKSQEDKYLEELGISKGSLRMQSVDTGIDEKGERKKESKVEIIANLTAAENRKIENDIEIDIENLLSTSVFEKNYEMSKDYVQAKIDVLSAELSKTKENLTNLRYKLNLVKLYAFKDGLDSSNKNVIWDGEENLEPTKSAKSVDGFNHLRFFSNKNKTKTVRIKIQHLYK